MNKYYIVSNNESSYHKWIVKGLEATGSTILVLDECLHGQELTFNTSDLTEIDASDYKDIKKLIELVSSGEIEQYELDEYMIGIV